MIAARKSWLRAWKELGVARPSPDLLDQLLACWNEGHRHYHRAQHLRECLVQFDPVRDHAQHPGEALGLWFHDAVYDPRRDDNEARSAAWARDSILHAGLPKPVADRVHDLVMATRHLEPPRKADAQLLVDVDLAILCAKPRRFDQSDQQIRAKYAHVPETQYRVGRTRILQSFLARPRIYSTDYFHSRLEAQARENLQRALARLGG